MFLFSYSKMNIRKFHFRKNRLKQSGSPEAQKRRVHLLHTSTFKTHHLSEYYRPGDKCRYPRHR
jgi:hypothetical protein